MRLAFCLYQYFPHGGLARDMLRIAREAVKCGHNVAVYARQWQGKTPEGLNVTVLGGGGLTNHGRAEKFVQRLAPRLREASYDAVVAFNKIPGADFYYAADACFAARARRRRPRVYELTPRYRSYRRLEQAVFGPSSGTRILHLSESALWEYRAFYATAEERTRLLPPTLDPVHRAGSLSADRHTAMRADLGAGEHDTLLLLIGSGFHTKGVDRALRALGALPAAERRHTRLAVAGRGKAGAYASLLTGLEIRDRVVFLGGRDDVPDLLRAADLLIHPARQENTGTVLLEALAAGLPVIATANCGYAHHVRAAEAGRVLEAPFDQSALNQALLDLLATPDRARLRANARQYGQNEGLYRMPEAAVDLIENWEDRRAAPDFAGYIHPELTALARRRPRLEDWLGIEGETFRRTADRTTRRFEHDGRGYFVKTHHGVGWKEILKNLVQLKLPVLGAGNEWLAIHLLKTLGLPTMTAVAYGHGPGWSRRQSFIVTRELPGMTSLEEHAARLTVHDRGEVRRRRRLIRKVAITARVLHGNGINHRDFYLCHFLLDPASWVHGNIDLYLIDLHRVQVRHRTPRRWRIKDIAGLYYSAFDAGLTRHERLQFIKAYSGTTALRGALADRRFWLRVARRARAQQRAEQKRGHADAAGAVKSVT